MLFWTKIGSRGLATELVKTFMSKKSDIKVLGRYRGDQHTSLLIPSIAGGISPMFQELTNEELSQSLLEGFELIKKQRPPVGLSIQQELDRAQEILKTLPR